MLVGLSEIRQLSGDTGVNSLLDSFGLFIALFVLKNCFHRQLCETIRVLTDSAIL